MPQERAAICVQRRRAAAPVQPAGRLASALVTLQVLGLMLASTLIGCGGESTTSQDETPTAQPVAGAQNSSVDTDVDADGTAAIAKPDTAVEAGNDAGARSATAAEEGVPLKIASWAETQKLVADHRGKVVVLDVWSTSCIPCLKEFPNLVALHKKFGADKVVCMSASCDYAGIKGEPPESYREAVLKFLNKQNATFENVLLSDESDEVFRLMDVAAIPVVFVYGPDGKLVKRFDNDSGEYLKDGAEGFTYAEHITPLVEQLLTETQSNAEEQEPASED